MMPSFSPVQTSIAGVTTGSLVNYIYGNNQTLPVVGQGATVLLYSDRHAYQVTHVNEDGMSEDQTYDLTELTGEVHQIEYRKKGWYFVYTHNVFTKSFSEWVEANEQELYTNEALRAELWGDTPGSLQLVPGKTRATRKYSKVSILFGMAQEYRDPTF